MAISFFNTDCIEFMKSKPDNYYDLAICDPPYGLNIAATGSIGRDKFEPKDWDATIPTDEYFEQLFRVSKNQIIWVAITSLTYGKADARVLSVGTN